MAAGRWAVDAPVGAAASGIVCGRDVVEMARVMLTSAPSCWSHWVYAWV